MMLMPKLLSSVLFKQSFLLQTRILCSKGGFNNELEYDAIAERTLQLIGDYLDSLPERLPPTRVHTDFDVNYAMGVLTVHIAPSIGTYVINKQTPNRQIWLSSPISGPKRYDYMGDDWIYAHDRVTLHDLLNAEFRHIYQTDAIDFPK
jgi:frataxin